MEEYVIELKDFRPYIEPLLDQLLAYAALLPTVVDI